MASVTAGANSPAKPDPPSAPSCVATKSSALVRELLIAALVSGNALDRYEPAPEAAPAAAADIAARVSASDWSTGRPCRALDPNEPKPEPRAVTAAIDQGLTTPKVSGARIAPRAGSATSPSAVHVFCPSGNLGRGLGGGRPCSALSCRRTPSA